MLVLDRRHSEPRSENVRPPSGRSSSPSTSKTKRRRRSFTSRYRTTSSRSRPSSFFHLSLSVAIAGFCGACFQTHTDFRSDQVSQAAHFTAAWRRRAHSQRRCDKGLPWQKSSEPTLWDVTSCANRILGDTIVCGQAKEAALRERDTYIDDLHRQVGISLLQLQLSLLQLRAFHAKKC